jgi:hypothetical protein
VADHLKDGRSADTERLFQVLEAYGADPARWPEAERENLCRLLALGDPAIAQAVKAARELDSILAAAPAPALDVGASRDRFLTGMREKVLQSSLPLDLDRYRSGRDAAPRGRRLPWPAFGALAASLAAGLFVGAGGMAHEFIPALLEGEASEEELWSPAIFGDAAALVEDDEL